MTTETISLKEAIGRADDLLRQRRSADAADLAERILVARPDLLPPRMILARAAQMAGRADDMLAHAKQAASQHEGAWQAQLLLVEALIGTLDIPGADALLGRLEETYKDKPDLLARLAEAATEMGDHQRAAGLLEAASARGGPDVSYNLATAYLALGRMDEAEALLERAIANDPNEYDAWYNRATLRKQTEARNHVDAIKARLDAGVPPHGVVQLSYALAKELEDLGRYDESFEALKAGAEARRSMMSYDVEADLQTMKAIAARLDEAWFKEGEAPDTDFAPIFVVGLPRTGTTLVDRILSSHSSVDSIGEVTDLPLAVTKLAGGAEGKADLVARAAAIEPSALGQMIERYMTARAPGAPVVLEKTPLNFLYLGLIAKALPKARIVSVRRDPMDAGYAIYKTLFRMGYPFSYDLDDLGRYMKGAARLMTHWEGVLGDRVGAVTYEDLVAKPEEETKELLRWLRLPFEPACLAFHENRAASSTASAAQVRQPVYTSSVGKWRKFEKGLVPLAKHLQPTEGR